MSQVDPAEHQPTQRLIPRLDREYPIEGELDIFSAAPEPIPPAPAPEPVIVKRKPTIQELFEKFHADHPEVYDEIVRLARVAKANGHKRVGMKMLFELIRWHFIIDREYDAERERSYTMNNVYTSRYTRLVMAQEPDLAEMFKTRELTSK